jgi:hypothetical protein
LTVEFGGHHVTVPKRTLDDRHRALPTKRSIPLTRSTLTREKIVFLVNPG